MEVVLFKVDNGWGFQIVQDGAVLVYQPTDITEGNKPMTQERAEQFGNEVLARLTDSVAERYRQLQIGWLEREARLK